VSCGGKGGGRHEEWAQLVWCHRLVIPQ
jgi:hypothetical protein